MAKVLVGLVQRLLRRDDTQLKLLLLCTVIATVGFAFPRLVWATYIGYSLIALLLTQVMVGSSNAPNWSDALYRGLRLMAVWNPSSRAASNPWRWPTSAIRASWPAPAFFRQSTTTPSFASPPSVLGTSARCSPCHGW